jgi:hypothetical protein
MTIIDVMRSAVGLVNLPRLFWQSLEQYKIILHLAQYLSESCGKSKWQWLHGTVTTITSFLLAGAAGAAALVRGQSARWFEFIVEFFSFSVAHGAAPAVTWS